MNALKNKENLLYIYVYINNLIVVVVAKSSIYVLEHTSDNIRKFIKNELYMSQLKQFMSQLGFRVDMQYNTLPTSL